MKLTGISTAPWQLIYDRLKRLGRLDLLKEVAPLKDWSKARDGGPRRVIRGGCDDLMENACSKLEQTLKSGRLAITVEIGPPKHSSPEG